MPDDQNLIFIAGCGRSGTTMTLRLFAYFADTHIVKKETDYTEFPAHAAQTDQRNVVLKRVAASYRILDAIPASIRVLYCVRHPYDVLTSYHRNYRDGKEFYIKPDRWLAEFAAYKALMARPDHPPVMPLRYEDTIDDADAVQQKIGDFFDLTVARPFSEGEKIYGSSLRKFETRPDFAEYLAALPADFVAALREFAREFDYDLPLHD